ncbi:MAG TPA: radical SAM protein [Roseiflexaceae bacterium]|nr:radical SAM protein [Roseiflexaceae bacterium]
MTHLRVLLAQLPVPNNPATNVPLAAGYLKAYAQAQGLLEQVAVDILPRALADRAGDALLVEAIVRRAPDVLGLSLYTWNSERSLEIARRVKRRLPGLLVLVGGPEVQRDNDWVLDHPAVDLAVVGEGEQTFAELLRVLLDGRGARRETLLPRLAVVPGVVLRDAVGARLFGPERVALSDLAGLPSPYLDGYLEIKSGDMLMVEVSRWCPYACSFCLYGRNMGPKLGSRYFGLERLLAEIRWGLERGATRVHFIEANLNLVPLFRPLMAALADLNSDGRLALYAELRGEHLSEESVAALARAGLRVAEVGLQTANPTALRAARRRTDLGKWAAGTRLLYRHGVEVLLDVILGLPEDDADGVAQTLAFIEQEGLGAYDIFTLQVLPGTAVRQESAGRGLVFQERPPYYVLATDRLAYGDLRRLRRRLKRGAGLDPEAVEGCPEPRVSVGALKPNGPPARLGKRALRPARPVGLPRPFVAGWRLLSEAGWRAARATLGRLATHVDVLARWSERERLAGLLAQAIAANPSTLFDLYLTGELPDAAELRAWREALPGEPGYLDRVAVYRRPTPNQPYERVSPRVWLLADWSAQLAPEDYAGVAELIWRYPLAPDETPPAGAWRAAGGAGILVPGLTARQAAALQEATGVRIWRS